MPALNQCDTGPNDIQRRVPHERPISKQVNVLRRIVIAKNVVQRPVKFCITTHIDANRRVTTQGAKKVSSCKTLARQFEVGGRCARIVFHMPLATVEPTLGRGGVRMKRPANNCLLSRMEKRARRRLAAYGHADLCRSGNSLFIRKPWSSDRVALTFRFSPYFGARTEGLGNST